MNPPAPVTRTCRPVNALIAERVYTRHGRARDARLDARPDELAARRGSRCWGSPAAASTSSSEAKLHRPLPPSRLPEYGIRVESAPPGADRCPPPPRSAHPLGAAADTGTPSRRRPRALPRRRPLLRSDGPSAAARRHRLGLGRTRPDARLEGSRPPCCAPRRSAHGRLAMHCSTPSKRLEPNARVSALINWGVDLDAFSPGRAEARRRLDLPDVPIVLSPRALKPVYNPTTVVDAFELFVAEFPRRAAAAQALRRPAADDRQLAVSRQHSARRSRACRGARRLLPRRKRLRLDRVLRQLRHARSGRRWRAAARAWFRICRGFTN